MSDRQFEPTPEKLRKARKEGKTRRSPLFGGCVLFLSVVYGIGALLGNNWVRIQLLVECLWSQEFTNAGECGRVAAGGCIQFLIIFMIGILFLSVSIGWFQVGSIWMPGVLVPDFKRVSPFSGCVRIGTGLGSLPSAAGKGMAAFCCLLVAASVTALSLLRYQSFFQEQQTEALLLDLDWFLKVAGAIFFSFGLIDLFCRRHQYRQQVFMNHQEMRREQRENEGDPHLKAHRRGLHQAISREEMIRQIRKSRVIVVERAAVAEGS